MMCKKRCRFQKYALKDYSSLSSPLKKPQT
jgi:hypothetical protein